MNKAQFLLLLNAWANTRNTELLALIEDLLEDFCEAKSFKSQIFTKDFERIIAEINKKKSDLGGREAMLVAGYNEEENKVEIWESIGKAARETDGNQGKISNCIKDGTRHLKRTWCKVLN